MAFARGGYQEKTSPNFHEFFSPQHGRNPIVFRTFGFFLTKGHITLKENPPLWRKDVVSKIILVTSSLIELSGIPDGKSILGSTCRVEPKHVQLTYSNCLG